MRYLHTMIRVTDLEANLDFFINKLGLAEAYRIEHEARRFTLVFLSTRDELETAQQNRAPLIELTYNWDRQEYSEGRNFGHVAYQVDNVYETCQRLADCGVTINRPPRDGRIAYVRSPENISIEFIQKGDPLPAAEPWASLPDIGTW